MAQRRPPRRQPNKLMSSPEPRGQMSDLASFDPSAMAGGGRGVIMGSQMPGTGLGPSREALEWWKNRGRGGTGGQQYPDPMPPQYPPGQRYPSPMPPGGGGGMPPGPQREFPQMPPLGGGRGPMGPPIGRGDISSPRGYPMPPSDFPQPMPWGGGIPNRPVDIPPFRESPRLPPRGGRNPGPPRPLSDFRPMGPIERGDGGFPKPQGRNTMGDIGTMQPLPAPNNGGGFGGGLGIANAVAGQYGSLQPPPAPLNHDAEYYRQDLKKRRRAKQPRRQATGPGDITA